MKPSRPYKLLSILLGYPDRRLVEARDEIAAAVEALSRSPERAALRRFVT